MRVRSLRLLVVLGAAIAIHPAADAVAASCPAAVEGYPTANAVVGTTTSAGVVKTAQLCEMSAGFGHANFPYTVKYPNWLNQTITYNKTVTTPLQLRALRRVLGGEDGADEYAGVDRSRPVVLWLHGGGFTAGSR